MDRNIKNCVVVLIQPVALRKESVDRNTCALSTVANLRGSLSARRAWIEIGKNIARLNPKTVALRKESVDRNTRLANILVIAAKVALRKESVDRNALLTIIRILWFCRSPQGERG